ncbi:MULTISPECIES: hypothetical protein [Brucella]|uniref:hypothetical protein n=1 Tax=Brucella TaxID=234 RepID=UPI00158FB730|nr:hypothetical protein [Brucella intermedia]
MGGLFSKPDTPKVEATRAPTEADTTVADAQKRARQQAMARSGRASTVLTRSQQASSGGGAGTTSYGNSLLGSAG